MKKFTFLAAAALSLIACDTDNNITNEPDEAIAAQIMASIGKSADSRASETKWENGDKIGVTMLGRYVNMEYTTAGDGAFTGTPLYFLNKQTPETLVAYYPFSGTETSDPGKIEFTTDGTKQNPTEQENFDFLHAVKENVTGSNPAVQFNFAHKMSKLTFVFKNGNLGTNVSKITSYTIEGLVLDGTFDTATGICSTKNVTAEPLVIDLSDTPVVANERTNPLIVFPQQPAGNSVTMKIHDSDNQNYTCELKFGENGLVAGNNYLFTITVKKTSLEVNSTITDWQTEENDESVAKSDDTDDESEEPEVPEAEE